MTGATQSFRDGIIAAMPRLYASARKKCMNHHWAEDLVQDTMELALANEHKFTMGTNLNAWLYTILRNKFLWDCRNKRREVEDPDGKKAAELSFEESPLIKLQAVEAMKLVETIPPVYRETVKMIVNGASYEEAGNALHQNVGTTKSRFSRGREILRSMMEA